MINKTIHYIWFGGKPLPKLALKCIDSWKKYCPDYEIVEWNESNFDINCNQYVREAYDNKKWAFVSDYVRLYVLYHYGGIYMDTDVEVIRPLDQFLKHEAFSGFENQSNIPTGIIGAMKNDKNIEKLLLDYSDRKFVLDDGTLDMTTNVKTITAYFERLGIRLNNEYQVCNGFVFYPSDYFCPKDLETKNINLTENTFVIHHFDGSWLPKKNRIKQKVQWLLGKKITSYIVLIKQKIRGGSNE